MHCPTNLQSSFNTSSFSDTVHLQSQLVWFRSKKAFSKQMVSVYWAIFKLLEWVTLYWPQVSVVVSLCTVSDNVRDRRTAVTCDCFHWLQFSLNNNEMDVVVEDDRLKQIQSKAWTDIFNSIKSHASTFFSLISIWTPKILLNSKQYQSWS